MIELPLAHVFVAREDLPIPEWLFAWGASIVLIVSFVALSAAWREPLLQGDRWRGSRIRVGAGVGRSTLEALGGLIGVGLLVLTVYAGLEGTIAPDRNFALTFVFVTFWLGFPLFSVLLGDVFPLFNPWRAVGRAFGGLFALVTGGQRPAHLRYPDWLGRWPAVVGLFGFAWLELVYAETAGYQVGLDPDTTAVAVLIYTAFTLSMMTIFGVEEWCRRGETFSVYFNMFAHLSPIDWRDGRLGFRRPLSGATVWPVERGSVALVLGAIAITSFDGAQEGLLRDPVEEVFRWIADLGVGLTAAFRTANSLAMLVTALLVAAVYLGGVRGMRTVRGAPPLRELWRGFAHTLIPIAFAYLVAHYFSLVWFLEQAQFTYLLSDPLGQGSDLFGTAGGGIDYASLSGETIWYAQVAALVVGHVAGLTLAHDRAVALWGSYRDASRSQYWMLAVMVAFTCFGLLLLSASNV